jgi:predicted nucleic acid-binding Zn ribbon protein
MTDLLPDHTHCSMCDEPIPVGEEYCSDECKDEYNSTVKKEARRMNYFYAAAISIVLGISLAVYFLGG